MLISISTGSVGAFGHLDILGVGDLNLPTVNVEGGDTAHPNPLRIEATGNVVIDTLSNADPSGGGNQGMPIVITAGFEKPDSASPGVRTLLRTSEAMMRAAVASKGSARVRNRMTAPTRITMKRQM